MHRFIRFGLIAGVTGGTLLAAGAALASVGGDPLSVQTTTASYVGGAVLRLAGVIAMILGVSSLVALCMNRGGALLLTAYTFAVAGLAMNLGWIWSDLFVSDTLAKVAPAVLDSASLPGTRLDLGALGAWLANLALVLLAVAVARTRTVTRASWIPLAVAGGMTMIPLPVAGSVYEVLIGVSFAFALAMALLRSTTSSTDQPDHSPVRPATQPS